VGRQLTHEASAFAPATVANLGPGFDVLGLALEAPGDTVVVRRIAERVVRIARIDGDNGKLALAAEKNTAGIAATVLWRETNADFGLELEINKGMPLGSGMGSSAASAVAAAVAAARVLGGDIDQLALLRAAGEGERFASGGALHYDNVAAALYGGLIRVRDVSAADIERVEPLPDWRMVVVLPEIVIRTSEARAAIPPEVRSGAVARLASNVDELVAAIRAHDLERAGAAILRDDIITPYRSRLITGYERVFAMALATGAAGVGISGSGPAMFALVGDSQTAQTVAEAMVAAFAEEGFKATAYLSLFGAQGARVL
jgi:homoserine kinase